MRIRAPFAGAFFLLLLVSAYLGLSSAPILLGHDKLLHFLTFFLLTICFYWILDTSRRRTLHLTLIVCTLVLGVGSEFLQGFINPTRFFDPYDIVANLVGSFGALSLCTWYHKRMLERKRLAKQFHIVPGDEEGDIGQDVELGEQESGITATNLPGPSLEEEVDNWDENAEDNWDDEPGGTESAEGDGPKTPGSADIGPGAGPELENADIKKRSD